MMTIEQLTQCAENEGGRARLAIAGYAGPDTAYYFARSAAHYARQLLNRRAVLTVAADAEGRPRRILGQISRAGAILALLLSVACHDIQANPTAPSLTPAVGPFSLELEAPTLAPGMGTQVAIVVRDATAFPVRDQVVSVAVAGGTVTPSSPVTNGSGRALVVVTPSGTRAHLTLTASSGGGTLAQALEVVAPYTVAINSRSDRLRPGDPWTAQVRYLSRSLAITPSTVTLRCNDGYTPAYVKEAADGQGISCRGRTTPGIFEVELEVVASSGWVVVARRLVVVE
jgi:hypothetical protein